MATTSQRDHVERWFLGRGLPHFIEGYSASRDVLTRALPLLTLVLVLELVGTLNSAWAWWVNTLVGLASFAVLVGIWAAVNLARGRRWRARPDRVGPVEVAVFVLVPSVLPLAAGGQVLTAVNTLVGNVALVGLVYFGTSYGVVPMTRWAGGRLWVQLADVLGLMVRALPLLLLFVFFLFLSSEAWQVGSALDGPYLAMVVILFVLLGSAFLLGRVPREVADLATFDSPEEVAALTRDTPAAPLDAGDGTAAAASDVAPLTRRQRGNVALVVVFSQGLQVLFASVMIGLFLVVLGLLAVPLDTVEAWTGSSVTSLVEVELWGRDVALTVELLQVATLLAGVAGFSFALSLLTDATYRREFLEDTLGEVRQAFAVREVYARTFGSGRGDAPRPPRGGRG